jgi:arogenate dehydrogenase (NADP+)
MLTLILCCRDVRTFIEANNDVILICTSILSFSEVLSSMPLACLMKPTTLFVDVLSVKEHPRELLLRVLCIFFVLFCFFIIVCLSW